MSKAEEILSKINQSLDESTKALADGGSIDMTELDSMVREFCGLIPDLPPNEARACTESLGDIVNRLNVIVEQMAVRKDDIEEEIITLNQRKKAGSAYAQATINSYSEAD